MSQDRAEEIMPGVEVHSFLDRTSEAVFARGRFEPLHDAYLTHAQALGPLPHEHALDLMRQALAGTVLHLALLPPDQFSAFTINLIEPRLNLFVVGDNTDFQVTGRVYAHGVKTVIHNRLFAEAQRPKHRPTSSMIEFEGRDLFRAFEAYYGQSVQMHARLLDLGGDDFLLVQGLPRVDGDWIDGLTPAAAAAHVDGGLEPIETRTYRFHCGCDAQKILMVLRGMFADKAEALFAGEDQVETACPRCGRTWLVRRQEFDARDARLGFS